jgi:hypothetical protein
MLSPFPNEVQAAMNLRKYRMLSIAQACSTATVSSIVD